MLKSALGRGLLLLTILVLAGCGFHLRGAESMPFDSLYIQDSGAAGISRDLKRSLKSSGIRLEDSAEKAQASLDLMSEDNEKRILSISGRGRVREFELLYRVTFRVRQAGSELWQATQLLELRRDYSFDDKALLGKEGEESRLVSDMRSEAVREIMRRLGTLAKADSAKE